MKMTKNFEIGDKVFLLGKKTKDCVITSKDRLFMFTIKGKEYKDGNWEDFEEKKVQLYEIYRTKDLEKRIGNLVEEIRNLEKK